MVRNISDFGFICSMMESFPICNTVDGQRPLICLTDDKVKASELVLRAGRIPVICRDLIDVVSEGSDSVSVCLRFVEILKNYVNRDQFIFIYGPNDVSDEILFNHLTLGASIFYTMQFGVEKFNNRVRDNLDASFIEGGMFLGDYRFCHCDPLILEVPLPIYDIFALDAESKMLSCGIRSDAYSLRIHRSCAFGHHRFNFWSPDESAALRLDIDQDIVLSWSDHDLEASIDYLLSLATDYFGIWKVYSGAFCFDGR